MKRTIFLLLLLLIAFNGFTQIITITDQESGQSLEMATLANENPRIYLTTNAKGQADISVFKGAERIEIRMLGYKTEVKSYHELSKSGLVFSLTRSVVSLDNIVISATRWNQISENIPARIIHISNQDVVLQNPQTTADLLGASGEVFIQKSQQGGGSPMIRGFSTNRLLYTVDGVRMNTAIFRSGNLQNVISLDPFAIENTEVFFGPGSVIYGSDAIGGVMSFQTMTPQLSLTEKQLISGKSVVRYSSANQEKTGHANFNIGWKKWASVTSFSYNDFGDLRMGSNGPDEYLRPFYVERQNGTDVIITNDDSKIQRPSAYSQFNIMQKLRFKPDDKWDFQYGFHYSETSDYSRYDRHIRYKSGKPRYGEWDYGPQIWMMNNLNITHFRHTKLYDQMTVRLAHQFFEESRISRDINKPMREIRTEKVNAFSTNIDFNKVIGTRHTLLYGVEAVLDDVNSSGINEDIEAGISYTGPSRYPQSTWSSFAAYVTDEFEVNDQLQLQAGMRYNHYSLDATFDTSFYPFPYTIAKMNNGALTGSFGFVWKPTTKWAITAAVASGFRSPNVDDMGKVFDSEPGSVIVPNPNLEAEYAYNIEAGIARRFGEWVKFDITGYYTLLANALVRRDFTMNGLDSIMYDGELSKVQAIQNAASAHVYGIQTGITVKLPAGFGFSSQFNYQKGEEELDDGTTSPSRHAPPAFGVSRITYSANKLNMQLYAIYSAKKSFKELPEEEIGKDYLYAIDNNGNPYSPPWFTLNLKAMYQLTAALSINAGIENLTDQRYRPYSSGICAPGRNLVLSMRANF